MIAYRIQKSCAALVP